MLRAVSSGGAGGGESLTIGASTITGGTTTNVLYNNAGVVGEYTISGSGSVAMATSPTLVTPNIGVATGTTLTLSGSINIGIANNVGWSGLVLGRAANAMLRQGSPDAAAPVAQTYTVQGVVAGTSNTAGVDFTIRLSPSTGSAAGGGWKLTGTPAGGSGTSQNSFVDLISVDATGAATFRSSTKVTPTTVASLPAAATAGAGARAFVTDALAPTFGATVAAGGALNTPVYSDGANWKVG